MLRPRWKSEAHTPLNESPSEKEGKSYAAPMMP